MVSGIDPAGDVGDSISGMESANPTIRDYVSLLRPAQWIKNVIVFAAPAASLKLSSPEAVWRAVLTFAAFCLAASAIYAFNDTIDRHADARHPTKKKRPIARGAITPSQGIVLGGMAFAAAVCLALLLVNTQVMIILLLYYGMMIAYSSLLKECVILDVIVLAMGFVLRAWAGAAAVGVATSDWLIACVFTLCLFLGFGKRRCEVVSMSATADAGHHRATLVSYTPDLLNHLITVSAGIAVVTFLLYTLDVTHSPALFPKEYLFYTLPIVVYGIFRFAMLTELGVHAGPTEIVLRDRWMLGTIILWAAVSLGIAYFDSLRFWSAG